ncbi:MAG: hypothetical protein ABR936_16555 [Bacteroidota bacterium]|jgi:hypothetical protein
MSPPKRRRASVGAIYIASRGMVHTVSEILIEAELWLEERDIPLWNVNDLSVECLREDVTSGFYILAEANGKSA